MADKGRKPQQATQKYGLPDTLDPFDFGKDTDYVMGREAPVAPVAPVEKAKVTRVGRERVRFEDDTKKYTYPEEGFKVDYPSTDIIIDRSQVGQETIATSIGDLIRQGKLGEASKLIETTKQASDAATSLFRRDLGPEFLKADLMRERSQSRSGQPSTFALSQLDVGKGDKISAAEASKSGRDDMLKLLELQSGLNKSGLADLLALRQSNRADSELAQRGSLERASQGLRAKQLIQEGARLMNDIQTGIVLRRNARTTGDNSVLERARADDASMNERIKSLAALRKELTDDAVIKKFEDMTMEIIKPIK
jgi:hypothetical protein